MEIAALHAPSEASVRRLCTRRSCWKPPLVVDDGVPDQETPDLAPIGPKMGRRHPHQTGEERIQHRGVSDRPKRLLEEEEEEEEEGGRGVGGRGERVVAMEASTSLLTFSL